VLVYAAVDIAQLVTLGIGVLGVASLIFTALRWRRDDTTAVLAQQDTVFGEIKSLNDELRTSNEQLRTERDKLREDNARLDGQVDVLRSELRESRDELMRRLNDG